jgi:hypothetical protein
MVGTHARDGTAARLGLAAAVAAALAAGDAMALPLFARETGESCAVCHAGSRATDKIGGFVPGLSVNSGAAGGPFNRPPSYVPLSVLLDPRPGNYGSSLGVLSRGGVPELRNLTVDSFWVPTQRLRLGAQYTIYNRPDGPAETTDAARAGTLFLYLRRDY